MQDKAIEILSELQKSNPFLQSIYLWGSITTDEYLETESDIDAIALVDESTDISERERLSNILKERLPHLKINFLYPSELNDGSPKSGLTTFIMPAAILYDLPAWIHVSGNRVVKEDFEAGRVSLDQIIDVSRKLLRYRFLPAPDEKDLVYFIKALAKLLYFINQKKTSFRAFRYGDLVLDSGTDNQEIAEIIFKLKKSNWDPQLISDNLQKIILFAKRL